LLVEVITVMLMMLYSEIYFCPIYISCWHWVEAHGVIRT